MLTHINRTLPLVIKKRGIEEKIRMVDIKKTAERVTYLFIKQKVGVLKLTQHTLFIKVKNNHVASDIRLKEKKILRRLKEENVEARKIKCTL